MSIVLSRFSSVPFDALLKALDTLDLAAGGVSEDAARALLALTPSPEERKSLERYAASKSESPLVAARIRRPPPPPSPSVRRGLASTLWPNCK